MCDYFYARCADPCGECWDSCGREDDQISVIRCSQQCNQICAPSKEAVPLEAEPAGGRRAGGRLKGLLETAARG